MKKRAKRAIIMAAVAATMSLSAPTFAQTVTQTPSLEQSAPMRPFGRTKSKDEKTNQYRQAKEARGEYLASMHAVKSDIKNELRNAQTAEERAAIRKKFKETRKLLKQQFRNLAQ